jgi:hypothetical protein
MEKWLIGMLASAMTSVAAQAAAPSAWFTVAGNPRNPAVNTVEVDPVALRDDGEVKTMNLRVSRATVRNNWEGVPYRSYHSQVAFNCRQRKAQYRIATFYMQPLWQGDPHQTTDYSATPRPMLFRDMEPNPTERILRAACRMAG